MQAPLDPESYLRPGWVESYSLWAMPKGALAEQLQKEIDLLAERHQGVRFAPHVTVVPDIAAPAAEVVAKTAELAASLKPYHISFLNVTRGAIYFQCVYLLCAKEAATMAASAAARKAHGMPPKDYMPHLSLLYSDVDVAVRDQVVAAEQQRLYGEGSGYDTLLVAPGFQVDSLALWYTPTEDASTSSWCKVAEFALGG